MNSASSDRSGAGVPPSFSALTIPLGAASATIQDSSVSSRHFYGTTSSNASLNSSSLSEAATMVLGGSSSASHTGAFLLSLQSNKSLEQKDLPAFVKEHNAALSFPEKLMIMLTHVDKELSNSKNKASTAEAEQPCISWILNGRAFIIRDREALVKDLLPLFFKETKFNSFTRKLYRWGFRQVNVRVGESVQQRREMIFGHDHFQRDNKQLIVGMKSTTAAGRRRAVAAAQMRDHEQHYVSSSRGFVLENENPAQAAKLVGSVAGSKRAPTEELEQALKKKTALSSNVPAPQQLSMMQLSTPRFLQIGHSFAHVPGGGAQGFGRSLYHPQQGILQRSEQLASPYLPSLPQPSATMHQATLPGGVVHGESGSEADSDQAPSKRERNDRAKSGIDLLLRYS